MEILLGIPGSEVDFGLNLKSQNLQTTGRHHEMALVAYYILERS